jgi:5-methylcytosine-specific restriction endonuclease McrA
MARGYQRKLPTTGYWIFVCNTSVWPADKDLNGGKSRLYYRISKYHREDFSPGQLGVLRVNDDRRSARLLQGSPKLRKGIYALFEIVGTAQYIADPDTLGNIDPARAAKVTWRVPVDIVANLIDRPVLAERLPTEDDGFQHIHRSLQTSTIPLSRAAFEIIVEMAGGIPEPHEMASLSPDVVSEIRAFDDRFASRAPIVTEVHSKRIERGRIGQQIKEYYGYHCQICSALGRSPVAFVDRSGIGFAEAHHVIPVSHGRPGSLSPSNIMVLCPNHHRQAHHGRFEIEQNEPDHWQITLDGNSMRIDKPMYPTPQLLDRFRTDGSALPPDAECTMQAADHVDR